MFLNIGIFLCSSIFWFLKWMFIIVNGSVENMSISVNFLALVEIYHFLAFDTACFAINFQKHDQKLQKHLYQLCFPIIWKNLWIILTKTSNLGQKPVSFCLFSAYVLLDELGDSYRCYKSFKLNNNVLKLQNSFLLYDKFNKTIVQILEFNHQKLILWNVTVEEKWSNLLL